MYTCKGRHCFVEELSTLNENELFQMIHQNRLEYKQKVSDVEVPNNSDGFKEILNSWFKKGRNYQFLVKNLNDVTCGTIFLYCLDLQKKRLKISCYFVPNVRGKLCISESLSLVVLFCLEILKVENIDLSVYSENIQMLKLIEKLKASKTSKSISVLNRNREVINFTFDRPDLYKIISRILKR